MFITAAAESGMRLFSYSVHGSCKILQGYALAQNSRIRGIKPSKRRVS